MILARRRSTVAAATLLGLLAVAGCNSEDAGDGDTSGSSSASSASGCDGPAGPAFTSQATSYDAVARVESGKAVGAQVSEPALSTKPSGVEGWAVAELKVQAKVVTNGIFAVSPDAFVLVDNQNKQCARAKASLVSSPFGVSEIDEARPASGTIGFLVPENADMSRYRVLYTGEGSGRQAQAAWSSSGSAPKVITATTCSTTKSTYGVPASAQREQFGDAATFGSGETVGMRVWSAGPRTVPLKGTEKVPNDVDGIAVDVAVTALGSVAFVERDMFQLVDGSGNLCRYGELGSEGETLASDLVPAGKSKGYRLIFWTPKGSKVSGYQLLFRQDVNTKTILSTWSSPAVKPAPSAKPKGTATAPAQN